MATLMCSCQAAVISVSSGGDLQGALNTARPGDSIVLEAGASFTGNFLLPAKPGSAPITVTTSRESSLPSATERITPAHAPLLASLRGPNMGPVLAVAAGAKHWVLKGLDISSPGFYTYDAVSLTSPNALDPFSFPDDITIDQCYIHGDATLGGKRGVALNGTNLIVRNSWISGFKSNSQDSQALGGWTGPGPISITNNYLEASGENILFGGAAPGVTGLVPSDITIANNHIRKPVEWKGQGWVVKNLLELKNARRVSIHDNLLENNWSGGQNGFAILFTVRTCEAGDYWWAVVQDVVFENNIVRNSDSGVNVLGTDNGRAGCSGARVAGQTSNITIRNNLFDDTATRADGAFLQVLAGAQQVTVDHNTVFQGDRIVVGDGTPSTGFVFRNNIVRRGRYGVIGNSTGEGLPTLSSYFPGYAFDNNLLINVPRGFVSSYTGTTLFAPAMSDVRFANLDFKDYRLAADSPFKNAATDRTDIGANMDGLNTAARTAAQSPGSVVMTSAPNAPLVQSIYQRVLGRAPTAAEMASNLSSGLSGSALAWNLLTGSDFNETGRFAAGLYLGILNRDPEYSGWAWQRDVLKAKAVNPQQLVANFLNSQEYALTMGTPDDRRFIALLYRYVLFREASDAEITFQAGVLAAGVPRETIATNFLNSAEFRINTGPRLMDSLLYFTLLGRNPSASELSATREAIAGGVSIPDLIDQILATPEAQLVLARY